MPDTRQEQWQCRVLLVAWPIVLPWSQDTRRRRRAHLSISKVWTSSGGERTPMTGILKEVPCPVMSCPEGVLHRGGQE